MGKPNFSAKQRASRRASWLASKIKFAKEAYYNNKNKQQGKEYDGSKDS